ncbi:MAG: BON domain-containing protein [Gemmatimonadetes bacterium]|nr:BON domain-containing protein [Gemmatimonadota bacterium]
MADDFENIYDIEHMDDQEIEDLIVQQLREYPDLDVDSIEVRVQGGFVTLGGRTGTEQEMQEVEHVVSDVLGIRDYSNEIVVDEVMRAEYSAAADDAAAADAADASPLGDPQPATSDTAAHLLENLEADMHGTRDMQEAISEGQSYNPPDHPLQEGTWSEENH